MMCVLLLLNAFVLLNKVNKVDDLFSELLASNEFAFNFDLNNPNNNFNNNNNPFEANI
jgi:hypothetical protein